MAYVSVPKDLTKVKTKFLFNLTKRQVICFGIGILMGVPLFFALRNVLPVSAALWTCIGYTVLLCFTLFKSSSVAKSIFNAH